MRIAYAGEAVTDQFSVWNEEGTAKVPGLVTFTKLSWKNAVSQVMTIAVTEIGTTPGEYMMVFTPPSTGFWKVEVTEPSSGDVFTSFYDVQLRPYRLRMSAVDNRTNVRFAIWAENEDGTRALGFTTVSASIREPDGTVVDDMGSATPTSDGVAIFLADSADVPSGAEYIVKVIGTQGALTWTYNLGFAKVA
jgi:hypothetical protein